MAGAVQLGRSPVTARSTERTASSATFKRIASIVMPAALPKNHPSPWAPHEFMTTICHELGHNLGCPDIYKGAGAAEIDDRYMTGWDLMDQDSPLPHFSLPHRMQLGWIHPDWIEVCDFGQNPASRTVKLHAIEKLTRSGPPAGSRAGVEVRIREGWNYSSSTDGNKRTASAIRRSSRGT